MLSVCILCKSADAALERAIRSLGSLPDELVVVADQACAADVQKLAANLSLPYPVNIITHFWTDDFSAARNVACDAAKGSWIFFLDADQEFKGPDRETFRGLLQNNQALAYWVQILDRPDESTGPSAISGHWHLNLFRNRDSWRFRGRVHEELDPHPQAVAEKEGTGVPKSPIVLWHDGYCRAIHHDKMRRNVRLIEMELRDHPGQIYYLIELGRNLVALGEPRGHEVLGDATGKLRQHRQAARPPLPLAAALLDYLLSADDLPAHRRMNSDTAMKLAERWFDRVPALVWRRAERYFRQANFTAAAAAYQHLLALQSSGALDETLSFNRHIFGPETRLKLGVCKARLARLDEAEAIFTALLTDPTAGAAAKQNLQVVEVLRQTG
ncbi:MAG: glycosyltransferase [Verrucomicrobiae bacterium]|nr:glycosyltransferase [Verrucomicrobiae bacterium]